MKIRLVAMDIDGTMTDGGIYMNGEEEFKKFDVKDGHGIAEMLKNGIEVAFLSGRYSAATEQRAKDLGVTWVFNGTANKLKDLEALAGGLGFSPSEVAFIGDDIPDLPCVEWAGLGIAVADAVDEVKASADITSSARGGAGAVREASEYILSLNADTASE